MVTNYTVHVPKILCEYLKMFHYTQGVWKFPFGFEIPGALIVVVELGMSLLTRGVSGLCGEL